MQAMLAERLPNKTVRCLACSWRCALKPGSSGICGVRRNRDGELELLVWSRPAALQIDPIEKKPLFHFLPGAKSLSIGTIGCNFNCDFCQNWQLSQASKQGGVASIVYERELSPKEIVGQARRQHIPVIAYTYNEPTIFFEYAHETAKLAAAAGIRNIWVSNGFFSREALKTARPYLHAMNIDLKAFSNEFYKKRCGARVEPVLENIKAVHAAGIWLEITTLIIPGENDSEQELGQIARFIAAISPDIPWHITAFHPDYKLLDKPATPASILARGRKLGLGAGLRYVYTGNVWDTEGATTSCPGCGAVLIERGWHEVSHNRLKDGTCPDCGAAIAGVWK